MGGITLKQLAVLFVAILLVAGCGVQIPGTQGNDQPPQIDAPPAEVRQYLDQVQPILESTARDVARVADVNVNFDGGDVSVEVDPASVEQARQEAQQGLDQLKAIDPPPGLQETHQRLVEAYEEGVPALTNFVQAIQSGDALEISRSVRDDLPKIQRLLGEIQTVQEQLQRAAN